MPKEGCTCICLLGMLIDPVFKMEKSNCKYCTANVFRRMQIHCQRKKVKWMLFRQFFLWFWQRGFWRIDWN